MLELRERVEASGAPSSPSQLQDLGTFQAAAESIRQTIHEDFGEPLFPVGVTEFALEREYGDSCEPENIDRNDVEGPQTSRREAGPSGAEV
jgi:hypothetical protein